MASNAARLTVVPGQPVPQRDVIAASRLHHSDVGVPGAFLDLTGRPGSFDYDVYRNLSTDDILTEPSPVMEAPITGTPIGGMTMNGGLAAAFDGNDNKGYAVSARSANGLSGYTVGTSVGLGMSSPQVVNRIEVSSPNDVAFIGNNAKTPWTLVGCNGGNFADAKPIISGRTPPYTGPQTSKIQLSFPNGVACDSLWWVGYGNGSEKINASQLRMWSMLPLSARGLTTIGDLTVNDHVMTATGNAGPMVMPVGSCEFLGTLKIDPAGGTVTRNFSYGLDRRIGYWNAKNQVQATLKAGNNITPNAASPQGLFAYPIANQPDYAMVPAQGTGLICVTFLNGMADFEAAARYEQMLFQNDTAAITAAWIGIGEGMTTPMGLWPTPNIDSVGDSIGQNEISQHIVAPFYGSKKLYALEGCRGNVSGFFGEQNQLLSVTCNY